MKKMIVCIMAALMMASISCAESLPATQNNIDKASQESSDASHFSPCPAVRPEGNVKGDTVIFAKDGHSYQYGSSMTQAEAYDMYCTGGGGE